MARKKPLSDEILKAFETVPDAYLILSPELYILTASNAYLAATLSVREEIVGKHVYDAFPDNPDAPEVHAVNQSNGSLQMVLATHQPQHLENLRYDVPRPQASGGGFEKKYWNLLNLPVLDDQGEIMYIIHKVSDVTQQINAQQHIKELTNRELEALAEANWQHQKLIDFFMQAPVAIGIYEGKAFHIEMINPLMSEILGRTPDKVIGKPLFEALPELKGQGYEPILKEVLNTGIPYESKESPATLIHQGELVQGYFHTVYQPLKNSIGEVIGIINIVIEVSEQINSRKKLEKSERQIRLITDAMPVLIGYLDKEERYRFANQAYQTWFNYNPEALIGKPVREIIGEKAYEGVKQYIDRALKGERLDFEARMPYPNGVLKYIRTSYIPDHQEGEVVGFFTLVNDITEQFEARLKIEDSERYFRSMADSVPVMIWITRPDGHCTYLNRQWYEYTDQSENSGLGLGWLQATHPEDAAEAERIFMDANAKQISFELIYRLRGKDGEYRWALDIGKPKFNNDGKFEGFIGVVLDMHERKIAEENLHQLSQELASTNEELRAANEEIMANNEELASTNRQLTYINADMDNFIYTASHDLRAPISNIEGLMTALLRNLPEDSRESALVKKLTGMIHHSIERFKKTLLDLTQITKIQREGIGDDIKEIAVAQLIREVQLDLSPLIDESDAQFELSVDDCTLIKFSPKNARSIVYNLISNALKYRSPDRQPHIQISCYSEGEYLILRIEDNGLGMDLNDESKIFAMFKRLHDHVEGTGVGLYIVKKIIENAGGKIEVQSMIDQGSVFKVYFKQA